MNTVMAEQRWNSYMAAFGATVRAEREQLLAQSVSEDVVFTNPGGEGQSRLELSRHIEKFQQAFSGVYFLTEKVYTRPDSLLAIWSMYKQDGTKVETGYNFVRPDHEGLFSYMAGFF
jgi:SnoaL-like domain